MTHIHLMAVAIGGALGSLARYGLTELFRDLPARFAPFGIPWHTAVTNILGSIAIGICFVFIVERALLPDIWRSIFMVGFLGGFTTFSTFSLQVINLLQAGRLTAAAAYILVSVVLALLGAFVGIVLARLV